MSDTKVPFITVLFSAASTAFVVALLASSTTTATSKHVALRSVTERRVTWALSRPVTLETTPCSTACSRSELCGWR